MGTLVPEDSFWGRTLKRGHLGVWMCGLSLNITILMALGLLALVAWNSLQFFWPHPLAQAQLRDGSTILGVVWDREEARDAAGLQESRVQFKVANRDAFGLDFRWVAEGEIAHWGWPAEGVVMERMEYGDLYGTLEGIREGETLLAGPEEAWEALPPLLEEAEDLLGRARKIEKRMGKLNREIDRLRLEERRQEMEGGGAGDGTAALRAKRGELEARFEKHRLELESIFFQAASKVLVMRLADGQAREVPVSGVVRIYRPNTQGFFSRVAIYAGKWWEFLTGDPRESNTEGGIFPALFGTFFLVILMAVAAVPLGVVAALYLAEYAREGIMVRAVRIAVQNLAGVPSIVFGVFGLGFFVYGVGGAIDRLFFGAKLPTPTFGTGGVLWASLTLALLTVPVVIVATEEALRAVPRAVREASYGLGATQWQTLRRVVLPAAMPGILTGLILAVARGAGEVAPLMITGVVKLAPALPVDGEFPFFHLDRKFMHLAFHIYDVGFQSPNVEAAKPMVYMTTLLLLTLVVALNLAAIRVRTRLREKYRGSAV